MICHGVGGGHAIVNLVRAIVALSGLIGSGWTFILCAVIGIIALIALAIRKSKGETKDKNKEKQAEKLNEKGMERSKERQAERLKEKQAEKGNFNPYKQSTNLKQLQQYNTNANNFVSPYIPRVQERAQNGSKNYGIRR